MQLKIKEAHHHRVVGFNNKALPLGQREDILELALIARSSGQKSLMDVFEFLPTMEELKRIKEGKVLPELPPVLEEETPTEQTIEPEADGQSQQHIAEQPAATKGKGNRKQRGKA